MWYILCVYKCIHMHVDLYGYTYVNVYILYTEYILYKCAHACHDRHIYAYMCI